MIFSRKSTLAEATPTVLGLWLLIVFTATTAAAADNADNSLPTTADDDFDHATEAFLGKNFTRAKRLYLRAYRKSQVPYILPNVALCSEKLGNFKAAISEYRDYLKSETNPEENSELMDRVTRRIQELEQKLVRVLVKTAPNTPPNAALYINDESVTENWREEPLVIDPGRVRFRMSCAGYLPRVILLNLPEGSSIELPFDVPVPIPKTEVSVMCDVRYLPVRVYIDDEPVGDCPLKKALENGRYRLTLKGAYIRTARDTFYVGDTASITLKPTLAYKRLWIPGSIALALGAVSFGLSGFLHYKWDDNLKKADKASTATDDAHDRYIVNEGTSREWKKKYDDYLEYHRKEIHFLTGMIVSEVIGGTLFAAGTSLILYHILKLKKGEKNDAISANGAGISVRF